MTIVKSTGEVSGACSNVSYMGFMGSGLAELTIENLARGIFDDLLAKLSSKTATAELARALRGYAECASTPIRVRQRTKEFETSCLRVVENSDLEVLDDAQLERYVLPLILRPDFQVLEGPIKKLRQDAGKVGLQWKDIAPIITRVADRLAQLDARSEGPEQQVAETSGVMTKSTIKLLARRRYRDPDVAARRTELGNVLGAKPNATAREICARWDFRNTSVPERWQLEGIMKWVKALEKCPNKVHKLISIDKKKFWESIRVI